MRIDFKSNWILVSIKQYFKCIQKSGQSGKDSRPESIAESRALLLYIHFKKRSLQFSERKIHKKRRLLNPLLFTLECITGIKIPY